MYLLPANSPAVNNRKWNLAGTRMAGGMGRLGRPPLRAMMERRTLGAEAAAPYGSLINYLFGSSSGSGAASYTPTQAAAQLAQATASGVKETSADGRIVYYNSGLSVDTSSGEVYDYNGNYMGQFADLTGGSATSGTATAQSPSPAQGNIVRAGSPFTYTVQWASSLANVSGPSQILSQVNSFLAQHQIAVDSSSIPGTVLGQATGFSIVGHTTGDFGQWADIKSILDGAVAQSGRSVTGSTLTPGASQLGLSSWLSENWPLLAAVGVGLVVVKEL